MSLRLGGEMIVRSLHITSVLCVADDVPELVCVARGLAADDTSAIHVAG